MAASKLENYSSEILDLSQIGRALAHPARVKIVTLLDAGNRLTNQELCRILELSKTTIHSHLKKIHEAGLITSSYKNKFALISRTENHKQITASFTVRFLGK